MGTNSVKGVFTGHTPRQHRASSRKGGLARIAKVTRKQQAEWIRKRWAKEKENTRP